jgi:hypothetical protein
VEGWLVADGAAMLAAAGAGGAGAGEDGTEAVIAGAGKSSAAWAGTGTAFFGVGRGADSAALEYASYDRGAGDDSGSAVRFGTVSELGLVTRAVGSSCLPVATGGGRVFGAAVGGAVFEALPSLGPWRMPEGEGTWSAGAVGPSDTTEDGL